MKICTSQCTETQSADRQLPALGRTVSELFSLVNHVVKKLSWKELSRSKETLDGPNYAQHGLLEIDEFLNRPDEKFNNFNGKSIRVLSVLYYAIKNARGRSSHSPP